MAVNGESIRANENNSNDQQRAINENGNLLVSAAAGAGKTYVLTKRIVRLVSEGARMDELLIVTFTRAAAAEMRERIEKELNEAAGRAEDGETRARLIGAAASVFCADISTIDVFCRNVLKRNYDRVGLDPAFTVMDDAQAFVMMRRVIDDIIEEFYRTNETEPSEASLFLAEALGKKADIEKLITSVYHAVSARPDPKGKLLECVEKYEVGENFDRLFEDCAQIFISSAKMRLRLLRERAVETAMSIMSLEKGEVYYGKIHSWIQEIDALLLLSSYDEWYNALSGIELETLRGGRGNKAPDEVKDLRKDISDYLKELLERVFVLTKSEEETLAGCLKPVVNLICELVIRFMDEFTAMKRENSQVDFTDLEQLALEALEDERIAEEYRNKYSHIFIDEYQDTNSLQDSIFQRISRGNNLFMVGDVKQSIYRFRQAEPEIFLEKYNAYRVDEGGEGFGKRIDLNRNFRSESAVLSATNSIFRCLMKGDVGEIDYSDNAALNPRDDAGRGSAELHLIEMSEELYRAVDNSVENMDNSAHNASFEAAEGSKYAQSGAEDSKEADDESKKDAQSALEELEGVEAEAELIADRITDIMQHGSIYDKEKKENRAPRYSDFAVILRTAKGFALRIVNALSKRGIPSAAELGNGYFDAVEVQIFINLLRIIDNIRQDIPLASVMLSPIGCFDEKELVLIRSAFRGERFKDAPFCERLAAAKLAVETFDALEAADPGENDEKNKYYRDLFNDRGEEKRAVFKKAAEFLKRIEKFRELSRLMEVKEFIGRLFDDTLFALFASAMPNGPARKANLDMILECAAAFENIGGRSLHGFIDYLDDLKDNNKLGAAQVPGDDAVRVMTIHKSKGLEFPVVFVCMLEHGFNKRNMNDAALIDRELGMGLKLEVGLHLLSELPEELAGRAGKSIIRRAIEQREDEKLLAEQMRLLYVAMTRAKERLILVSAHKTMAKLVENNARELTDARILGAKSFIEWILGALFPLGLNLKNALGGLKIPIENDELTVFYRRAGEGDAVDRRVGREDFARWLEQAARRSHDAADKRLSFSYPHAEDTAKLAKRGVTESLRAPEEYKFEPAVPSFIAQKGERSLSAAERGTLTHRFIMLLPLEKTDEPALTERLKTLEAQGFFTHDEARAVDVGRVLALTRSPIYEAMLAARGAGRLVLREKEFSLIDGSGALIQGIVDCCYEDEDGQLVLVDYKTTALRGRTAEETAAQYAPQLEEYAEALEALTGKRVSERWIYLLGAGEAVRVE